MPPSYERRRTMKPRPKLIGVIAGAAALLLSGAALLHASPVSAAGPPINAHEYPMVPGVNGSQGSIVELGVYHQKFLLVHRLAPETVAVSSAALITEHRQAL